MRISMNQNDLRISNGSLVPTCSAACRSRTRGKDSAFQRSGGCRPGNASWGYSRPWLGQRLDSAKTAVGLIENVLSLVLSWHCLGTLGSTRCPSHSGRLCQTRTQPSRSGPEGPGLFPAEHGGHGRRIARPESRAGVGTGSASECPGRCLRRDGLGNPMVSWRRT
jgi:hypothetical protein